MSCSERCRRGLLRSISSSGVSKLGGRRATVAARVASAGTRSLHTYHQAMSWGLTNETVVHHGSAPPSCANHSRKLPAIVRVVVPALAGTAVGRGVDAAGEAVALERRFARRRRPVVVAVGEVPLAEPARVVAVLAQHRPLGREARVERAAAGDHAAGLVGVEARQQRGARGRAVVGGGVVAARRRRRLRAGVRRLGGSAMPIGVAENHCGKRSWSTTITRMFGRLRRACRRRCGRGRGAGVALRCSVAVGVGERLDAEPGARERRRRRSAPRFRNVRRSTLLCCSGIHAFHASSHPGAGAGPRSGVCRPDRHRRGAVSADVRPREPRTTPLCRPVSVTVSPLPGSRDASPADADQLPRRARERRRASSERDRARAPARTAGPPGGLLAGRRRELRAEHGPSSQGERVTVQGAAAGRRRVAGDPRRFVDRRAGPDQHDARARSTRAALRSSRASARAPTCSPPRRDGDRELAGGGAGR